jgi:hypothetical protein
VAVILCGAVTLDMHHGRSAIFPNERIVGHSGAAVARSGELQPEVVQAVRPPNGHSCDIQH